MDTQNRYKNVYEHKAKYSSTYVFLSTNRFKSPQRPHEGFNDGNVHETFWRPSREIALFSVNGVSLLSTRHDALCATTRIYVTRIWPFPSTDALSRTGLSVLLKDCKLTHSFSSLLQSSSISKDISSNLRMKRLRNSRILVHSHHPIGLLTLVPMLILP